MTLNPNEYQCGNCGNVYPYVRDGTWSEEKVEAEAIEFFGAPIPIAERVVVCDDCYVEIMKWAAKREAAIAEQVESMLREAT